ncbi:hypothetical protein ACLI09_15100 [Flavobacterium sp. RHBU_24]|uniref:hypothetical protein n=1 Tax=Flavobacterium sp. RHBU_24 TaxID=3391185 RepID=UPI003984F8C4
MAIKKIFTLLFITCCLQSALGQVVLSSHYLDLQKADAYHDALPAPEANNRGLVVFAADKNTVTALRYTRVLYYADSLATDRPSTADYELTAGYSYSATGQPSAYWASADFKKVQELQFDFDTKKVSDYSFEMLFKDEDILLTFSANNSFHIVTLPEKESKLYFYVFNEGRYERHTADFSDFKFDDGESSSVSFHTLLETHTLQKMEAATYNPLPATAGKLKLFISKDALQLTFDQNPAATQIFTIEAKTYKVSEKIIPKPVLEDGDSNSFLHGNKLYHIAISKNEMALQATDLATGNVLKSYTAGINDTISFKNSALLEQTGNKSANIFKNTKKFIRRANMGTPAISVYQTPNDILVVSGAIRATAPAGEMIVGSLGTIAMAATGVGGDAFGMFPEHTQSIYIESLFDESFNHKNLPQERLAADYIGQYMYEHEKQIALQTVFPYEYYYVLGYYNAKAKKYILLKFMDDGIR